MNVAFEEIYRLALECIDICSQRHKHRRPAEPALFPRQVIDCEDSSRLIILTIDGTVKDFSAALSYVWGQAQSQSTLARHPRISSCTSKVSTWA